MSQPRSGFRGVNPGQGKKWYAYIQVRGRQRSLGSFNDELSAAQAYDRAATEAFAEPVLNFNEDGTLNPDRKKRVNARNVVSRRRNGSRFRGVSLTGPGRWCAVISVKGRRQVLGTFTDEREAAKAYDRAAKRNRRRPRLNFADDEGPDVSAHSPAMVHQKSGGAVEEDVGWISSDEDEGGLGQQSDDPVPPSKRSRSSSGAEVIASKHSPPATAAAPATHGQSAIDLTMKGNGPGEDQNGMPPDPSASTAAYPTSSSSSSTSTPAASSASPLPSAAVASTSSRHEGPAGNSTSTSDVVEQLYHAVMKARMDARETQQKVMLKRACALFNNPTAADAVLAFARRTITNAFGAVDLSIEEHRTTVVEMFIEQLVEE